MYPTAKNTRQLAHIHNKSSVNTVAGTCSTGCETPVLPDMTVLCMQQCTANIVNHPMRYPYVLTVLVIRDKKREKRKDYAVRRSIKESLG